MEVLITINGQAVSVEVTVEVAVVFLLADRQENN